MKKKLFTLVLVLFTSIAWGQSLINESRRLINPVELYEYTEGEKSNFSPETKSLKKDYRFTIIGEKAEIFLDLTVTDYQFNHDKITIVTKQATNKPESEIYENIDWVGFLEFYKPATSDNQNIEYVGLVFKNKVKTTFQGQSKYGNSVILSVRKENVEAVKKAILHLVKLAKEEDSNPFK